MPWKHVTTSVGDVWEFTLEDGSIRTHIVLHQDGRYTAGGQKSSQGQVVMVDTIGIFGTLDEAQHAAEKWIAEIILETQ